MKNLHVKRLKKLPRRADDTWQGGLIRLPGWITGESSEPHRPRAPLWTSKKTRAVHLGDPCDPGEVDLDNALQALIDFATDRELAGYRPGRLEVNSADLAEHLSESLSATDIDVSHTRNLKVLREFIRNLTRHMQGREPLPGPLQAEGVNVERMRAFAEAAADFFEATLWQELSNEDPIRIEAPDPIADMRYAVVLGAGGQIYGLGFYPSLDTYWQNVAAPDAEEYLEEERDIWFLSYGRITNIPFADADLYEDHQLPIRDARAYPYLICHRRTGQQVRPDASILSFVEGLLRALSKTATAELDSGQWVKEVATADGEATYRLSLPLLLDPPDREFLVSKGLAPDFRSLEKQMARIQRFMEESSAQNFDDFERLVEQEFQGKTPEETADKAPPRTALEKAQDLCYDAFEAYGRRKVVLARKALETCPDCADAYVILAENTGDDATELYTQGVAAGRRALGEEIFREGAVNFWDIQKTRPFIRALFGLAHSLQNSGQPEQAVCHYRQLLRLNPDDNTGIRYHLLPLLIDLDRDDEARGLLEEYEEDTHVVWEYSRALLAFRRAGDSEESRELLRNAMEVNPHVPGFLMRPAEAPSTGTFSAGSKEEALMYCQQCGQGWIATPEAMEWLESQTER